MIPRNNVAFVLPFSLLATALLCASPAGAQTVSLGVAPNLSVGAEKASASVSGGRADVHLSEAASSSPNRPAWARFASGTGAFAYLALGTLLPLVEDGKAGGQHALRSADSLLTSAIITEGLKSLTHEKRLDGSDYKSFPSGHATAAFAVAAMQAYYHPKQALLWYAGATAIAASRVTLHRHYTHDVLAGAAIGFLTSQLELKQRRGLLLSPFISGTRAERVSGVSVDEAF